MQAFSLFLNFSIVFYFPSQTLMIVFAFILSSNVQLNHASEVLTSLFEDMLIFTTRSTFSSSVFKIPHPESFSKNKGYNRLGDNEWKSLFNTYLLSSKCQSGRYDGYYVNVTWCRRDSYVIPTFSLVIHGAIVGCPSNTVPKQPRLHDNLLKAFCIPAGMRKQSEKSITEVTQWPTLGPKQTSFTMSKEWSALGGTLHLR